MEKERKSRLPEEMQSPAAREPETDSIADGIAGTGRVDDAMAEVGCRLSDEELEARLDAFVAHLPAELTPQQIAVLHRQTERNKK